MSLGLLPHPASTLGLGLSHFHLCSVGVGLGRATWRCVTCSVLFSMWPCSVSWGHVPLIDLGVMFCSMWLRGTRHQRYRKLLPGVGPVRVLRTGQAPGFRPVCKISDSSGQRSAISLADGQTSAPTSPFSVALQATLLKLPRLEVWRAGRCGLLT